MMVGMISNMFICCSTGSNKIDDPDTDNDLAVHDDDADYASSGFSTFGELSWNDIMQMDSIDKREFYSSLTDSLPNLWETRNMDSTNYIEEDTIPTLHIDYTIYLYYKQKVSGYQVWVDFMKLYDDMNIGQAILHFSRPGHTFMVYCDAFSDRQLTAGQSYHKGKINSFDLSVVSPGDTLYLNYICPQAGEYLSDNSPFYFRDMDYDGEEELVVNNLSMGPRGYNTYDVFKVHHGKKPFRLKGLPFTDNQHKITNYNVEYEPDTKCVIDKRYDGSDAYGHYRYQSIPTMITKNGNRCKRVFILKDAEDMGFYHPKNRSASDSVNLLQPYKKYRRVNGKMVLVERGVYERGHYGRYLKDVVLEKMLSKGQHE